MGHTANFFTKKKSWSILKDRVIGYYLRPYITKIITTGKPLVIVDSFAGKGKFDDGNIGSPIIIADYVKETLTRSENISAIFIEKKYVKDLKQNISTYKNCSVLSGTFEDNLKNILVLDRNISLFIYVDPYGIKSLNYSIFEAITKKGFYSLELLMNFNTFGFLREGCRLLNHQCEEDDEADVYEEHTIENMNKIANGIYWQDIIKDMKSKNIDIYEAEKRFSNEYKNQIKKLFKYVVDIPIKKKARILPKYRLIFCTNHPDGLILMADEMNKAWKIILEGERQGQGVLFECEFPSSLSLGYSIEKDIIEVLNRNKGIIKLKELLLILIQQNGVSFAIKEYNDALRKMDRKTIDIIRHPAITGTGREATSLNYRIYQVTIKLK